jgi:hypothetical protein
VYNASAAIRAPSHPQSLSGKMDTGNEPGQAHVESRSTTVLAVTAALMTAATIFVSLRLISRGGIVRRLGWDDAAIVLAWVSTYSDCLLLLLLHPGRDMSRW